MRPVAGAVGACSLMLLACSWFAFRPGGVDAGSDLGSPAPVRIDDSSREAPRGTQPQAGPASTRQRAPVVRRSSTSRRSSPGAVGREIRPSTGRPQRGPLPAAPAEAASPSPAPPVATPPAAPSLPASPHGLPTVTLPPVSLPQLPSVQPPEPAITTPLGLP